ncbi:SMC-Scp complex subunit ScpB [Pseudoxanthomonas wuyuanensis]|uniref:SMC-Scp complex subunit ScpB n=1 Tax=Pseudoxanthomonas wuyuanensis TaxID=1073196 RepID=UPI001EE49348|nr:SMC-Scp complex subunit ScpB [Pseudoxanthomonas wuyuanensis]
MINRIVEAALLAATQPLTLAQLHGLFPEEQPAPPGSVEQALEQLREACADRGVELVEVASGFRYQVKADVHAWVARLWTERKTKYTRATLETLALIAYRQPITRGEIEQVRGVAVSSNIIQALEEREWIRVVGHRDVPGKPALFGTTKGFLDYFGLKRLDELPPLSELKDIGELEPQLQLDDAPLPISIASGDGPAEDAGAGTEDRADAGASADESGDAGDDSANPQVADDSLADGQQEDDLRHSTSTAGAEDVAGDDGQPNDTGEPAGAPHQDNPTQDDDAADSDEESRAPSEQNQ